MRLLVLPIPAFPFPPSSSPCPAPQGNLAGAVAEAGFALGLERNAAAILGASYAPLLVNDHARPWPTNLVVFDNRR